jgi:hypothetical protein
MPENSLCTLSVIAKRPKNRVAIHLVSTEVRYDGFEALYPEFLFRPCVGRNKIPTSTVPQMICIYIRIFMWSSLIAGCLPCE